MEPITRKEKYLAAIVGQAVELPEPITREEMFLAEIAMNGGGGGTGNPNAVLYTPQNLSAAQKKQARDNVGAVSAEEVTAIVNESLGVIENGTY